MYADLLTIRKQRPVMTADRSAGYRSLAVATYRLVDVHHVQIGPCLDGDDPSVTFERARQILETFPAGRLDIEELDEATGEWLATGRTFGRFV